ncbi:MAG: hypothetical protein ACOYMW_16065 [Candidatus Competibacteraceae bacterium]
MRTTDLITRCTHCRETVLISHDAMQHERLVICPRCGTPAYFWQLLGEVNREEVQHLPVTELQGTGEGVSA